MKTPLYLLDSYAVIYRSYFAFISRPLTNPSGQNVSALFGFFRALYALFDQFNPSAFAAVFDSRVPTFRHVMYDQYKANRQKTPDDLHAQIPLVEEVLELLKLPLLRVDGFEADDIIATLAERCRSEDRPCYIISGDKDLLQLVGGPVKALKPDKDTAYRLFGPEEVQLEWGIRPEQILDYLALTGDASDNIPGVAGIGDKTAGKLLVEYADLEAIYAALETIKPDGLRKKLESGKESAELSHRLATLEKNVPLSINDLEELSIGSLNRAAANPVWKREGMRSLIVSGNDSLFSAADSGDPAKKTQRAAAKPSGSATVALSPAVALSPVGAYEAILDIADLDRIIAEAEAAGSFALDCETDSLDELTCVPVGISLCVKPGKAVYIPVQAPGTPCIPEDDIRARINRLLGNPSLLMIGQNLKFDRHVMEAWGCSLSCACRDTMIAAWLLDPERASVSLESLAESRLGTRGIAYDDIVPKGAVFSQVPLEKAYRYAAEDADFTLRLYLLFEPELKEAGLFELFRDVEMPLLPLLGDMERSGILLDREALRAYGIELTDELASIEKEIYALVGHEFNIQSTKQLQHVLFEERKLSSGKKTKTGFSTDVSVLEELARDDPVPERILRHRTLSKLKSTYVEALLGLVDPSGRVHTHYMQAGTATGRLSSRDPNLQNIPVREEAGRRIRKAFTAAPGKLLISADYAQIELVVFAHLSGDAELKKAFMDGSDVHRRTASLIFGIEEQNVTPEQRRIAKTINFGVIYGMGAFRLSAELDIKRGEAAKFIDAYFERYSGVKRFIDGTIAKAEHDGFVSTILGRRRPASRINSGNKNEKQAAERVAVNTPIQGSAADIVKLAMLRVDRSLKARHPNARMLLQVHDELIIEADENEAQDVARTVKAEMEAAITLSVPLRASMEISQRWGDMH